MNPNGDEWLRTLMAYDDDVDLMYDVLSNDIHLSSTTFEWLNGI